MRVLLRLVLVVLVVVAVGFLLLGFWAGHGSWTQPSANPVGTTGAINTEKARERAAELGAKAAETSAKVQESVAEAGITAKIKAKMTLDDTVKARTIDVSTTGTTVTLNGTVESTAERDKAVALARETAGVTQVVDHLTIQR